MIPLIKNPLFFIYSGIALATIVFLIVAYREAANIEEKPKLNKLFFWLMIIAATDLFYGMLIYQP